MSSTARAERRRLERAERKGFTRKHLHPDGDYGVQPGWFLSLDDLDLAKQQSHDMLIEQLGDRRIGPVQWRWWTGDDAKAALAMLRTREPGEPPLLEHEADIYRRIGAHLREYGGYVIVAVAEANR